MQLYFIDDSGTVSPPDKLSQNHFVLGGLSIPEEQWHYLENDFSSIRDAYGIEGEIKWRFFGQRPGREDRDNTLAHLDVSSRDKLRIELLHLVVKHHSIKVIVAVAHMPTVYSLEGISSSEDVYFSLYETLTEKFQYHLQDQSLKTGRKINGIIVSDHRNPTHDRNLRNLHLNLLNTKGCRKPEYRNLIESLFLSPSHHSIGIQFADLISGSIFRCFEHADDRFFKLIAPNFLTDSSGEIEGYGLIKIPQWKEKDAESSEPLEPALVTQSQRNLHANLDLDY